MDVLHVVDADLSRGAQRGAQMLRDALDDPSGIAGAHRLATIFTSEPAVLHPDVELDVTDGTARALGWAPGAVSALKRNPDAQSADVLVAHGGEALKYLCRAHLPGALIYHKIGVVGQGFDRWASARLHRWAIGRADAVVAISNAAAIEAVELLGVDSTIVHTIANGRDPAAFRPNRRPRDAKPSLAFVGHMTRTKRPEWFLDVVEQLASNGYLFEATMAGDGPNFTQIAERAETLGVTMLGQHDHIANLLADTDIFVFPSMREGEGMPGVLIEAAMSGAVPVATNVPGVEQVIGDGGTGFLVDTEDFASLYNRVGTLLDEPERRRTMARNGRNRAMAHFSTQIVAGQWRHLCTELGRPAVVDLDHFETIAA